MAEITGPWDPVLGCGESYAVKLHKRDRLDSRSDSCTAKQGPSVILPESQGARQKKRNNVAAAKSCEQSEELLQDKRCLSKSEPNSENDTSH